MNWHAIWKHSDGLAHVVGLHETRGGRRVYAECGVELCGLIGPDAGVHFAGPNTHDTFPTCLRCWFNSNFGTYRSRP